MTISTNASSIISVEWQAFFRRHINFHRVLWVLILVSFFIAWNRGLALLYGLFSLFVAVLAISYLLPNWQLRRIRVKRKLQGDYSVGRPGRIAYDVEARGVRYHIELEESFDFSDQQKHHFFFDKISHQATCQLEFNCRQRGCFQLNPIQLASAYPFGVMRFSRHIPNETIDVLVFPKVVTLSALPKPLMAATTTWGDVLIPRKGGRDEFAAVREYVHGDEMKSIHWSVSARHQQLVVKEYEITNRPAMLIVLDCFSGFNVGQGNGSTFEVAVSMAASMIRQASREGIQCFLAARDGRMHEMAIQAFSTDLHPLYELLARLNCDSRYAYQPVVAYAHKRFPQANLVTTFRLSSDTTPLDLSPNVTQVVLEMDETSFHFPEKPAVANGFRRDGHRLIYPVHAKQRLETIFQ